MGSSDAATLAALRLRFAAATGNLAALEALNEELRQMTGAVAVDLQCDIMAAVQALRAGGGGNAQTVSQPAASDVVGRILARGTPGQPLYRYAVTDEEYEALRARLDYLHQRGGLEQANDRSAATFALYVSEWFRREYDGGGYSWDAPYPALIGALSDAARKALARQGLAWWGRVPRRTAHGELRLMSLALEGGFPTRLLESREDARIPLHLVHLLARVESAGTADEDRAVEMSRQLGGNLGTYDNEEFHTLCAELVLAIAALKAEAAQGAPAGISATVWLDAARDGWRDALPISLSGDGAKRLLDDMVSARAIRIGGDARTWRLLILEDGQWKPALRLGTDGDVRLARTRFRPSDGRLRVHAAGALTSVFAGELGLIEPPTDDEQGWLCRPRGGRRLQAPFPFEAEVQVELRAGSVAETIVWPQGEALRSEILLFADEAGEEAPAPSQVLGLVGRGSLRTRRTRLFCRAPNTFSARALDDDTLLAPFWRGPAFSLFELTAPARVGPPGGDHYRIEVGADGERAEQLVVEGDLVRGLEAADPALPIYDGTPSLRVRRGGSRAAALPAGEVRWRRASETVWRDWPSAPPTHGVVEVVWRDPTAQALRDRQTFIVLPKGLQVTSRPAGRQRVAVELDAAPGWTIRAGPSMAFESRSTTSGLEVLFPGRPLRRLPFLLEGPGFEVQPIFVRVRIGAGGFFRADGRMFDDRASVMLDDLRGAVAYSEGPERLYLDGPERGQSRLAFVDETPLWALSEEVTRLLSGGSGLDDKVKIEFGRGDGPRLSVGRYDITLKRVPQRGGPIAVDEDHSGAAGTAGRRLEWFSILEPGFRLIAEGEGPAMLPPDCHGPGVALLREGERVIGRPTLALGDSPDPQRDWCRLQAASMIAAHGERGEAIDRAIGQLGEATPEAMSDRDYLHALVGRLRGLPPSSMDALRALAASPTALAALIATATDDPTRQAIWALERDLPFLWGMIPIGVWSQAFDLQRATLTASVTAAGLASERARAVVEDSVTAAAQALADLDPLLRTPLVYAGLLQSAATPPSLAQCANDRVARIGHLVDDQDPRVQNAAAGTAAVSCFRTPDSAVRELLPEFKFLPVHWEGLDAACALALAAAGQTRLTIRQILRVRQARAEEPLAFTDMFAAALNSRARGKALTAV